MVMTVMFNGIQFAPVSCKQSLVVPHSADILWSVVGKFGGQALWMGTVEGQPIFSQLLGGESADYIGSARVFGIADKLLFEQLTKLDHQEMLMCWQLMTHPMNSNPFPAAFVNCKASLQVTPVTLPGGSALVEWRIDLLTEQQHVQHMTKAMDDIMIVGLTNLIPYMNKSTSNSSGGHSSSSTRVYGSLQAPAKYGVQYMPQPAVAQSQMQTQPFNQAMNPGAMTGDSAFLQQPSFVPAPGESLDSAAMPDQATPKQAMPKQAMPSQAMPSSSAANYPQQSMHTHMSQQYPQQQQQYPQQQQQQYPQQQQQYFQQQYAQQFPQQQQQPQQQYLQQQQHSQQQHSQQHPQQPQQQYDQTSRQPSRDQQQPQQQQQVRTEEPQAEL